MGSRPRLRRAFMVSIAAVAVSVAQGSGSANAAAVKVRWHERHQERSTWIFSRDDLGAYVQGPFIIDVPWSRLRGLLRTTGLLAAYAE